MIMFRYSPWLLVLLLTVTSCNNEQASSGGQPPPPEVGVAQVLSKSEQSAANAKKWAIWSVIGYAIALVLDVI